MILPVSKIYIFPLQLNNISSGYKIISYYFYHLIYSTIEYVFIYSLSFHKSFTKFKSYSQHLFHSKFLHLHQTMIIYKVIL